MKKVALIAIFLISACSGSRQERSRDPWDDLRLYPRGETVQVSVVNKNQTLIHFCARLQEHNPLLAVFKVREWDEELYEETRDVIVWQKPIHILSENDWFLTIRKGNLSEIRPCSPTNARPRYERNSP